MTRIPQTGCRHRFTATDWQFIIETLGLDEGGRTGLARLADDPDSVRHILDHPKLFEAVLLTRGTTVMSLDLFFFVLVRHTLTRIGIEDLEVADYVAVVCAEFGRPPARPSSRARPELEGLYSLDYLQALGKARSTERFFIHVQCANRFLVLTCLYPAFLHHRAGRRGAPDVEYYEQAVVSHLGAAGRHALAGEFELQDVLVRLAEIFPPVRRAINGTLREYLSLGS